MDGLPIAEEAPEHIVKPLQVEHIGNVRFVNGMVNLLPFYGPVAAGVPIDINIIPGLAMPCPEQFTPGNLTNYFVVQAKGDSMINAGINNNDYLLIERTEEFRNNAIMLVKFVDESTVK
jgi:SOS-response transcriptional repressor LexA